MSAALRHEAFLYADDEAFLDGLTSFARDAVAAGEPILVMLETAKLERVRDALDGAGYGVEFADMAEVGHNPARIIPAWQDFVARHAGAGRPLRGVGEPIWPGRSPAEVVECQAHESLLDVAFADAPAFWLLCPYDSARLDVDVLDEARRSHPSVSGDGPTSGTNGARPPHERPLPAPAPGAIERPFDRQDLSELRGVVGRQGRRAGLGRGRIGDLVLAVNELATNSLRYGGGRGLLRLWHDDGVLVCEVHDDGHLDDPMAGRRRPSAGQGGGRGLWIVNQLCDLVQVRSSADGTVVRLHMAVR
jgi:anti-sigma regulatory factor (Ser/Thr protein kinase)